MKNTVTIYIKDTVDSFHTGGMRDIKEYPRYTALKKQYMYHCR